MAFGVVQGKALRVSKSDKCGKPLQGPGHTLTTDGFIRIQLEQETKARNDIEQTNASGNVCVSASSPAERKWWNITADFCGVDPELFNLMTSWALVLDYNGNPIGLRDSAKVNTETGVVIELWTGNSDDESCDIPLDDSIFANTGSGVSYGYFLFGGKEFMSGGVTVEDGASTFQLTGRTMQISRWGRGVFNVQDIDDDGTAGRMLAATSKTEHLTLFKTFVPPPEPTNGACELAVQSIFDTGEYYGPNAIDIAPPQPICGGVVYDVVVGGTGNWKAIVAGGTPSVNIAHTALPAAVQTAIENLPNVEVGQVQVTGVAGNYDVTLAPELGALTTDSTGLTGGSAVVTPH